MSKRDFCIGSGVPGDWFEHGHFLLPGTAQQLFPPNRQSRSSYFYRRRCYLCDSMRRYWKRSTDATDKARHAHRSHARKMVKFGLMPDIETAVSVMDNSGVTIEWMAETALAAFGKPCPGLCFQPTVEDDRPVVVPHVITEWNDMHFDWHDPRYPLSRENSGWLCPTCNKQKGRMPWPEFMARQHAIRMNYLQGTRELPPLVLFDYREFSP